MTGGPRRERGADGIPVHDVVSGNAKCCKLCRETVVAHAPHPAYPFLFLLCDGRLVKVRETGRRSPVRELQPSRGGCRH
jgi:hypothetical protein